MSSNIRIIKICEHCGKEFEARKITTRTCSSNCANNYYKARKRAEKIKKTNLETHNRRIKPIEDLKAKEYLTVKDLAILLNSSLRTIYRLVNDGTIKAVKISTRKTLIKHSELDRLFQDKDKLKVSGQTAQGAMDSGKIFDVLNSYTIQEAVSKFVISEMELNKLVQDNNIPMIRIGWFKYIPKTEIDKLMSYKA
jgi:excisionase family DNA binding protein